MLARVSHVCTRMRNSICDKTAPIYLYYKKRAVYGKRHNSKKKMLEVTEVEALVHQVQEEFLGSLALKYKNLIFFLFICARIVKTLQSVL